MANIKVLNMAGKEVGEITLSDAIYGADVNGAVLHAAVRAYLLNQRQGTQSALTRSEVSGGGKKPWRQKGTGRARQGSTRSPQWTHGGIVFAPKPRSYRTAMNRKVKRIALYSALSAKMAVNEIVVLDAITTDSYKTKTMVNMLKAVGANNYDLVSCKLCGECTVKSDSLYLAVHCGSVRAGLGSEDDTTVSPLRRTGGTLSCTTGTLLTPRLLTATGNFGTGKSGLSSLSLIEKVSSYCCVKDCAIYICAVDHIGKGDLTNFLTCHI